MAEKNKVQQVLRRIPSVDKILKWEELQGYQETFDVHYLTLCIREVTDGFRARVKGGENLDLDQLKPEVLAAVDGLLGPDFRYAVNALGVILHTGLGRAPFNPHISKAVGSMSLGYSRLQIDDEGKRGDRYHKINTLLRLLTGAEAGMIVNNCAAATMVILNTLGKGKEIIVSRGQLIEIGGSFRIPDIMEQSGAFMREVGTTNRTHLRDYENAIGEETAALLKVHTSNYKISGFTKEVPLEELVELGKRKDLPVFDDLGSGALIDLSKYGLPKEDMVQDSVKAGADIICFSGDKLIGGPQCGIIVGKNDIIDRIKKNPLVRSLRCDKLTNATLEAALTLFLYKEEELIKHHGVLSLLLKPLKDIKSQATRCANQLKTVAGKILEVAVKEDTSEIGGGTLSTETLPTYVVAIKSRNTSPQNLAKQMRQAPIPIYGRVAHDTLLLDFRTVFPGEGRIISKIIANIISDE